jgi:hypothetical protein
MLLDSAIPPLMALPTIRTTYLVDLATPTPRKWTNYPGGITLAKLLGTLTLTAAGSGFTAPPLVSFSGGGGQDAQAIAKVAGGVVTALIITSRGWGYTSAPAVAITGGGGTGATATSTLGVTYPYADLQIAAIAESGDGTSVVEAMVSITNTDNAKTDLVSDGQNANSQVSIQKVWRDSSDGVAASQIWLEGSTGQPRFKGEAVTIACHAYLGRRGASPRTQWKDVMLHHQVPAPGTTISFITITQGGG